MGAPGSNTFVTFQKGTANLAFSHRRSAVIQAVKDAKECHKCSKRGVSLLLAF